MMDKLFQIISWITLSTSIGLILVVLYWYFCPYEPVTFETPYPIVSDGGVVERGNYISYEVKYCKNTEEIPIISKYFVDSLIFEVPIGISANNPLGCHTNIVHMYVPRSLPPGIYSIKIVYRYQVNPLRVIDVIATTERFEVR